MAVRPPFDPDDPSKLPSTPAELERWVREVEAYVNAHPHPVDPEVAAEFAQWRASLAQLRAFLDGASEHGGVQATPAFTGTSVDNKGSIRAWHLSYGDEAATSTEDDDAGPSDQDRDRTA